MGISIINHPIQENLNKQEKKFKLSWIMNLVE